MTMPVVAFAHPSGVHPISTRRVQRGQDRGHPHGGLQGQGRAQRCGAVGSPDAVRSAASGHAQGNSAGARSRLIGRVAEASIIGRAASDSGPRRTLVPGFQRGQKLAYSIGAVLALMPEDALVVMVVLVVWILVTHNIVSGAIVGFRVLSLKAWWAGGAS